MNVWKYVCVCGVSFAAWGWAWDWGILKIYVEICASKIQNTARRSAEGGEAHFIRIRNAYSKFILACTCVCVCGSVGGAGGGVVLRQLAMDRTNAHDHLATRSLIA